MYLNHSGQTRAVYHQHAAQCVANLHTSYLTYSAHDELQQGVKQLTRSDKYEMLPLGDWNRGLVKLFNKRRGQPLCKRTGRYRVYSDFARGKMIQLLCVKADDLTCLFIRNDALTDWGSSEIRPQAPSRLPNASKKLTLTREPPRYHRKHVSPCAQLDDIQGHLLLALHWI